jgi:hypothetical protein
MRSASAKEGWSLVQSFGIVLMCILAAVVYGIAHDQVTARVCVEYFTVGHPLILPTEDPTLLGLIWGVVATWWVGLLLGVPLAVVARAGSRPKRSVGSLVRPVALLLLVMAACALAAGVTGWTLARTGAIYLVDPIASVLPGERHAPFLADAWAHSASYLAGMAGGVVVLVLVWRSRARAVPHGAGGSGASVEGPRLGERPAQA